MSESRGARPLPRRHGRRLFAGLLAGLFGLLAGCGYTVNTRIEGNSAVKTVAIMPFKNLTDPYVPGAEITLHDALLDAVMAGRGSYRIADIDDADLIVTGEISRFRQAILSQRTDLEPSEISVSVQVRVHLDMRKPIRKNWSDTLAPTTEAFALDSGETLDETAERAFRVLAHDVIATFVAPNERWGGGR